MRCAGYNNVNIKHAFKKIHIVRVPAYSPNAVAEHAMALLLCLNRKIHKAYLRTRDFNFNIQGFTGFDLFNKTVGVIGTGKIGQAFINICKGFGMKVIAYDPYPNPDPAQSNTTIQGQGVYILNATDSSWEFWYKTNSNTGFDLGVGQGFFVNVKNSGTNKIMFTKTQIHEYEEPQCQHGVNHSAKSSSQRGFIRLSMIADNVASELLFAHNEDAQQYYDIYDANKLFAMERMTEPYFVTDGIKLVKEEVKEVPYYATMNVRSYEEKEVKFRADYIPEGYAVSIIDGEETIDLNPGVEYTTEVSVGENANRFKVLVKKSVGLNDVEELAIDITNSNRIVNISTNETNLQIEVYNALGQKVLSTRSLNFSLNEVSAGAYMIKAFNSKGSKTQKIIIK